MGKQEDRLCSGLRSEGLTAEVQFKRYVIRYRMVLPSLSLMYAVWGSLECKLLRLSEAFLDINRKNAGLRHGHDDKSNVLTCISSLVEQGNIS